MGNPNTNSSFIGSGIGVEATARNGYKVICITVSDTGEFGLLSPHFSKLVAKLDDDSVCGSGKTHKNTDSFSSCTCGFYGYYTPADALEHRRNNANNSANFFVAQAAYSGDVVVAEHGMRASHQRIRKVFLGECWNCDQQGVTLAIHAQGVLVPACASCGEKVSTVPEDFPVEMVPSNDFAYFEIEDRLPKLSLDEKSKLKKLLEEQISEELLNSIS